MQLNVSSELLRFVAESQRFGECHDFMGEINPLHRFLDSRMDEVRIYWALEAAEQLLSTAGAQDALAFQFKVLERERLKKIKYERQRDHTCHTLNNYLLGWYIYVNNDWARSKIGSAFKERGINEKSFMYLWIYVSLLHDIGYIFEGGFGSIEDSGRNREMEIAVSLLKRYFDHDFWRFYGVEGVHKRVIRQGDIVWKPNFDRSDLKRLICSLETLGSLRSIQECYNREVESCDDQVFGQALEQLPDRAFSLWERNYAYFGNTEMASAIKALRQDFFHLAENGLDGGEVKVLDHGVCSGLILLAFVTYFYSMHTGVLEKEGDPQWSAGTRKRVVDMYHQQHGRRRASGRWWWSALVWATAATALHNRYHKLNKVGPLPISRDPIAYLGILVDELQVWDRFKVFDGCLMRGRSLDEIPVQSSEIFMKSNNGGPIVLSVPAREHGSIKGALDERLLSWSDIVTLQQHS